MLKTKNFHLLLSSFIVAAAAIVYGLLPNGIMRNVFQFTFQHTDQYMIFRAFMGLYLGMAIFWFIGTMKPGLWMAATLSNILFMVGLAAGRIISLLIDGIPSSIFTGGLIAEILLAAWGIINLKKHKI